MAKDNENVFAFDVSPFVNGIKQITKGVGALKNNAANMAKSVSKGIINATAKIGLLAGAFKAVKFAINEMPEIGQTFQIAKNIITKNLLFPLRKAVFPLLQKFLNWVRDNRAMFVRWGQTLANIFQTVVKWVGEVISIGKRMFDTFLGFVNRVFGSNIKSLQDLLNVLSFKMAVVFELLKSLVAPATEILNVIADIVGTALAGAFKTVSAFVSGFITGLGDIRGLIDGVLATVQSLVNALTQVTSKGNSLSTIFNTIGETLGSIVGWIVKMGTSLVNGFIPYIEPLINSVQRIADGFKSIFDSIFGSNEAMAGWQKLFKFLGEVVGGTLSIAFQAIATAVETIASFSNEVAKFFGFAAPEVAGVKAGGKTYDDVIVTDGGRVVPVNSEDDILSFKPGGPVASALTGGNQINIDLRGMQIFLQDSSPAEAERAAEAIVDSFRVQLSRELERSGQK